ncbi:MAG: sugar phosphate isomerase/epimerase [Desulfobacterales bacterium]|nr:sugar phosphate isomerase/epimerase [Desulfobacterales bacterium]
MAFAYSTNAFVKYSLKDAINKISEIGFGGVEIMCDIPHLYPLNVKNEDLDDLQQTVDNTGIKITNLNCFTLFAVGDTYLPSWIESDPARRDVRVNHTLQCIEIAASLGCRNISIPPGGPLDDMSEKEAIILFHKELEKVIPFAEEMNVKLLIEPEPELLIEKSKQIKSFVKNVASDIVGINFDIGHFYCVGEPPDEVLDDLIEWVGHMHLEDIARNREHKHLIPGEGAINFRAMFSKIRSIGYEGDICLELYPYIDNPEEAGIKSMKHLSPIFRETEYEIYAK